MNAEQKEWVRKRVWWKLASVPPDVREYIVASVTRQFVRLALSKPKAR